MKISLNGIFGPVVSTFTVSGELDLEAFAANVRAHMSAGLHGVVVAGSTGEAALLDEGERVQLVAAARNAMPDDRLLIAGTGLESTRATLRLTRDAAAAGANAVLVVSPHYYTSAMTADTLGKHFRRVADESPVPVLLYNIPKYVGFAIAPNLVGHLSKHDNIVGIKDSSGDRDLISVYLNEQNARFGVLTGNAGLTHFALKSGATGGILAAALFAPQLCLDVYNAMARKDEVAASAAQARLSPMAACIVGELGVPGVKAAMDAVGLRGGPVRPPLMAMGEEGLAKMAQALRDGAALSLSS